ncbi:6-phospho-5-dehydro-2-deoxy-D-gluconate aldolase [Suicoccus acidiformans]|uniref:6-phospho-5-dehydro-2-deoxy-D-gluconate aldolase n=1 Tax=Suicoccus acidiformans TaxID=2036206 RepID=A0A347WIW7_9LACT|nr:class II fructose-bisphosphate aldolase [Suicoccus acidiformans]AXY25024.1 6-phospho-5-dehydro-2-deoxy-D-gluconate aldolase [Suicoccus acidiformans]
MHYQTLNDVLYEALAQGYAVPQFNINGYTWIEAIMETANELELPVIIGVTDRNVERLGGYQYIKNLIDLLYQRYEVETPVVLHLDHGQTIEGCKAAIDAGFSSVMYDGSHEVFEDNVKHTKEVVEYAHRQGVSVEGEIGGIGGIEDGMVGGIEFADPKECQALVEESGLDALAPALGSVHGEYQGKPDLQFHTMKEIQGLLNIPLVLHGASGLSQDDIHQAISYGHAKINFNTELNKAWSKAMQDIFVDNPNIYDPSIILPQTKSGIKAMIREKYRLCKLIK